MTSSNHLTKARAFALATAPKDKSPKGPFGGGLHSSRTGTTSPDASSGANIQRDEIANPWPVRTASRTPSAALSVNLSRSFHVLPIMCCQQKTSFRLTSVANGVTLGAHIGVYGSSWGAIIAVNIE